MEVELREHRGINIATGVDECLGQYRVFVDGRAVGFMGWGKSSKLSITTRVGPIERQEIAEKVSRLMMRDVQSSMMPDVPDDVMQPEGMEDATLDDLDA